MARLYEDFDKNDVPVMPCNSEPTMQALSKLKRGQSMIYHIGYLAKDRANPDLKGLNHVAGCALNLAEMGKLDLVQRRLKSPNGFPYYEYIARGRVREEIKENDK